MVKKDEKEQEDMDSNEAKEIDSTEEEDKNTKQESGIGKDGAKKSEDNNEKMDSTENNGKLVMLTASDFYMSHFSFPSSIPKPLCYFLYASTEIMFSLYMLFFWYLLCLILMF